jgi:transposase
MRLAGIDVHKKLLMVAVAETEAAEVVLHKGKFGTGHAELQRLVAWLRELGVQEVVMESTAQYWRPVWTELERASTGTESDAV